MAINLFCARHQQLSVFLLVLLLITVEMDIKCDTNVREWYCSLESTLPRAHLHKGLAA